MMKFAVRTGDYKSQTRPDGYILCNFLANREKRLLCFICDCDIIFYYFKQEDSFHELRTF